MRRVATTESTDNPSARARTSSAKGLFQIVDGTWNELSARYPQLGLNNRMDPIQQARVAPYYMREINENLTRVLGRAPTASESKLGWVFGPTGGAMILKASPDTPVDRVLDTQAIASNPGIFKNVRTVGDLYAWAGGTMGEEGSHPKPRIDLMPYLAKGHDASHLDKMDWDLKSRLANMVADMPENLRASSRSTQASVPRSVRPSCLLQPSRSTARRRLLGSGWLLPATLSTTTDVPLI
ncbi:hypothetical protein ASF20_04565 [Methylobacterium sp. Leaf88]|nr:hypothetical protein ASF20_04565 [Methylobacterium sp. Leaf88]